MLCIAGGTLHRVRDTNHMQAGSGIDDRYARVSERFAHSHGAG
jgi:hypothetical protein